MHNELIKSLLHNAIITPDETIINLNGSSLGVPYLKLIQSVSVLRKLFFRTLLRNEIVVIQNN